MKVREVTPERRALFGLKIALRMAELFPSLRAQIKNRDDLLFAAHSALERVDSYWAHWQAHPDFPGPAAFGIPYDPLNPAAVAVYKHAPAREGKTTSFAIGGLLDCVSYQEFQYGKRRLGELIALAPVSDDFAVHPTRMLSIDNSYSAGGAGYVARMKLKEFLPRELWPWIQRVRSAARDQKYHFLASWMRERWPDGGMSYRELFSEYKDLLPVWYSELTKMELWYDRFQTERRADLQAIEGFIAFEDLWRVCTNKVMPEDVPGLLKQQQLFQIERRRRSGLDKQPRVRSLHKTIASVLSSQALLFNVARRGSDDED